MTRENNFDIVRLILASIVVLVHIYDLSASPQLLIIPRLLSAHIAVDGFFAISGFLIFASYERCKSLREYISNRAWRIIPAYWLATSFCLGLAFAYGCFHVGKFLIANLTFANFLQPGIPGMFRANPDNSALNGSLWTIKIEVMFYCSVPLIVWCCRRLQRDLVLWSLFAFSIAFRLYFAERTSISLQLPGQLSYFVTGALIYYHRSTFQRYGRWFMLGSAVLFGFHLWTGWFVLRPASLGALILGCCLLLPHFRGPTRWGDFSYGAYILHWPIIQTLVEKGFFQLHPWRAAALALILTAVSSFFSWFCIERPALSHSRSRRLRQRAAGATPNYPAAVP